MVDRQRQTFTLLFVVTILPLLALRPAAVMAQENGDSASAVQFNGHSFALPHSLADGFTAFVIDEPTEAVDGSDSPQPPRTEFRLLAYSDTAADSRPVGWVSVYTVGDLEAYPAYAQYERLRDILSERPDLSDETTLPTLYPYQRSALPPERYSEFFVNAAYLESGDYRGITFIYGRVIHLGDHQPILFYRLYFEGISSDEQRYLSAQVEGLPELIEPLEEVSDLDEYISQARALFDEPVDEAVLAWLEQANVMFTSFEYSAQL